MKRSLTILAVLLCAAGCAGTATAPTAAPVAQPTADAASAQVQPSGSPSPASPSTTTAPVTAAPQALAALCAVHCEKLYGALNAAPCATADSCDRVAADLDSLLNGFLTAGTAAGLDLAQLPALAAPIAQAQDASARYHAAPACDASGEQGCSTVLMTYKIALQTLGQILLGQTRSS